MATFVSSFVVQSRLDADGACAFDLGAFERRSDAAPAPLAANCGELVLRNRRYCNADYGALSLLEHADLLRVAEAT